MLKGERAGVVREEVSREEAMGDASAVVPPAKKTKRSFTSFFQTGQHRRSKWQEAVERSSATTFCLQMLTMTQILWIGGKFIKRTSLE